jgi:hypothetical protein
MTQLTVRITESVLAEAELYARAHGTSLDRLVGDYLAGLACSEGDRRRAAQRLRAAMDKGLVEVGEKSWRREDLYER